ncbi:MAG TPA: TonB-dependent receptor [Chitinophagaceae bacterium]|nr:TonB-dependent receptor [Chitinophagaceae bacterium]
MKKIIFSVLLLFSINLPAQKGIIEGYIKDGETSSPLPGASILVTTERKGENTDQFGKFRIADIIPGNYELVATHIGYKTEIILVEIKENLVSTVLVNMKKANLDLEEIKLEGRKDNLLNTLNHIDIMLRPVNTSQDVLRIVPGLFIAQHAGGGKAEQIFLRGYDIDHGTDIQITVDDMPVNMVSHTHGQGYADLHFLIPETVEKVNFDKGPYFSNKGNQATAGFVEFQTKAFIKNNTIKLETGRFNTQRAVVLVKLFNKEKTGNRKQIYLASEYSRSDSYFESSQDFHRFNLMGKYNVILSKQTQLTITASSFDSKWNASGQIPERAVKNKSIGRFGAIDNSEGGYTGRTNFNMLISKQWKNDWKSNSRFYYSRYHFKLFSNFTFFLNDPVKGDQIKQKEKRNIYGYSTRLSKSWLPGNKNTISEMGWGFRLDDINDIELSKSVKRLQLETLQTGNVNEINMFLFWNQQVDLTDRFTINGGIRIDAFQFKYQNLLLQENNIQQQHRNILSPKLNFVYSLSAKVKIYFNNGIGFHSNDTRVILNNQANDILPKVLGSDLGLMLKPASNFIIKTAIWQMFSQQEFVYVGDEGIIEPGGKTKRTGLDLSLRYQFSKWLFGDFDLNLTKARATDNAKGENYVPLAAALTSIGGITAKSKNGFNGSFRYRFITDRPANEFNTIRAKGYIIADIQLSYSNSNFEFSLSAENIFNSKWREAQFETNSRLQYESEPVSEIHFTPGSPMFLKAAFTLKF